MKPQICMLSRAKHCTQELKLTCTGLQQELLYMNGIHSLLQRMMTTASGALQHG